MTEPLVRASGLTRSFSRRTHWWGASARDVRAVRGVDLEIHPGETVGLVGESGSGKSTLGRMLIRLLDRDAGELWFDGVDLGAMEGESLRKMRRQFQIVFQDPYGSLNPRMRIGTAIGEPLTVHGLVANRRERDRKVAELLKQVGLEPTAAVRYPHEFSGGQRQRIGIARAIACSPRFIVADEPVSALDPPVQAQIINLMLDLQEALGLAYLFIAHDLRLVQRICDRVAVMYLGRIVEMAPTRQLFAAPRHPYTRALLASTPSLRPGDPAGAAVTGEPPSVTAPPVGCSFLDRCPLAIDRCRTDDPGLLEVAEGHRVACHVVPDSDG
ncbi:MAG: ATP-binding cassette domain-containing protein [Acidobacteriota bacterium]|nr:ATP-binding cassette domain-containing protein [Acidobacteriota bacterium]MDH3784470.1 ATP-binding cassette domain-containing protein [Acidobacteriota bacterium]